MSKNCQKLDIFSKKLTKIVIFFNKIANGNFVEKNDNFCQIKKKVFVNFLTFKCQFSGGSAINPLTTRKPLSKEVLINQSKLKSQESKKVSIPKIYTINASNEKIIFQNRPLK